MVVRRNTWQREAVREALDSSEGFVSAQSLHGQLRDTGSPIGLATVYRALSDLAAGMARKSSFYASFARPDADTISHHEKHNPHSRFFTVCTVFAKPRAAVEVARDVPPLLARYLDHVYADDVWDRQVPDARASAHAKMGLDAERGGVVVVRPDGYVGAVVRLEEGGGTVEALNEYFGSFVTKRLGGEGGKLNLERKLEIGRFDIRF